MEYSYGLGSSPLKIIKKKKAAKRPVRDAAKERLFREIAAVYLKQGVTIRREKLKQGHGWKVLSGSCRAQEKEFLFVDSRLGIDDQLVFLLSSAERYEIEIPEELFLQIPENLRALHAA